MGKFFLPRIFLRSYDEEEMTTFSTSNVEIPFLPYLYLDLQENILLHCCPV